MEILKGMLLKMCNKSWRVSAVPVLPPVRYGGLRWIRPQVLITLDELVQQIYMGGINLNQILPESFCMASTPYHPAQNGVGYNRLSGGYPNPLPGMAGTIQGVSLMVIKPGQSQLSNISWRDHYLQIFTRPEIGPLFDLYPASLVIIAFNHPAEFEMRSFKRHFGGVLQLISRPVNKPGGIWAGGNALQFQVPGMQILQRISRAFA